MGKIAELDLEMVMADKNDNFRKITKRELETLDFGLDEDEKQMYNNECW